MQVISSLLSLEDSLVEDSTLKEVLQKSINRIHSLAIAHESLYHSESLAKIDLKYYLRNLLTSIWSNYLETGCKVSLNVQEGVYVDIDFASTLGLLINELITNVYKHAFPDKRRGMVSIELSEIDDEKVWLRFSDNGVGMPENVDVQNPESLGLQIIMSLITQLHGEYVLQRENGVKWEIAFPYKKDHRMNR
jgi:two-component sensor histidine kinase